MRVFGASVGVSAAASLLSWRLEMLTGVSGRTLGVAPAAVLQASTAGYAMVAVFTLVAGYAGTVGLKARAAATETT